MLDAPKSKPQDLETIARSGGVLRRIAARIPTYLTDVRENPVWLPMFLLARTMPFRKAHWLTAKPARSSAGAPSMFGNLQAQAIATELRRTGIFVGLTLPAPIREEIARFGHETPCFGNFERKLEFLAGEHADAERRFGRTILSGHHFERVLQCDAAIAVQRDPLLLDVARHYLGGEAKLITTRTWWSFPTKSASEADLSRASFKFHFELDDWRMLKFFFYLTEAYKTLVKRRGKSNIAPVRLAFCLAHARRKFVDVVKLTGSSEALSILARIAEIYRIEAGLRGENADTRLIVRRRETAPIESDEGQAHGTERRGVVEVGAWQGGLLRTQPLGRTDGLPGGWPS
jgi:hypothetical protein